jgi:hypothetical protein
MRTRRRWEDNIKVGLDTELDFSGWQTRETLMFEVFTAVRMMIMIWVLAPCKFVLGCQRFGEIHCLHLHG